MNARDCKHGRLARNCELCELERERDEARETARECAAPTSQRFSEWIAAKSRASVLMPSISTRY